MKKTEELSDIAQEGREFLAGELGLEREDFEVLGKIARLRDDKRVESVRIPLDGDTIYHSDNQTHYVIKVKLVKPLLEREISDLLEENDFAPGEIDSQLTTNNLVGIYETPKSRYDLFFYDTKLEEDEE